MFCLIRLLNLIFSLLIARRNTEYVFMFSFIDRERWKIDNRHCFKMIQYWQREDITSVSIFNLIRLLWVILRWKRLFACIACKFSNCFICANDRCKSRLNMPVCLPVVVVPLWLSNLKLCIYVDCQVTETKSRCFQVHLLVSLSFYLYVAMIFSG